MDGRGGKTFSNALSSATVRQHGAWGNNGSQAIRTKAAAPVSFRGATVALSTAPGQLNLRETSNGPPQLELK